MFGWGEKIARLHIYSAIHNYSCLRQKEGVGYANESQSIMPSATAEKSED